MMLNSQNLFLASLIGGFLLDFAAALPASSTPADTSVTLTPIQFCDLATQDCDTVTSGSTLSSCDPRVSSCKADPVLKPEFRDGRQSCGGGGVYEGTHYQSSTCLTSGLIQVNCVRNDQPGLVRRRWIACAPTEICVQNNRNPSYAKCEDLINLVLWRTASDSLDSSTQHIHVNKRSRLTIGNMYYDVNDNPITVMDTSFFGFPGNVDEGFISQVNRAYSKLVDFSQISSVTTTVDTGGAGSIKVATYAF